MSAGLVLATVGTTKFDDLIRGLDNVALLVALQSKGYTKLLIQHGNGSYRVQHIFPCPVEGFDVQLVEYLPELMTTMAQARLVISHCGAGSTFEALTLHVPLIVVPNPMLMDNHQVELATLLERQGHLVHCSPGSLVHAIEAMDVSHLRDYQSGDPAGIARAIDSLFYSVVCKPPQSRRAFISKASSPVPE